MQSEKIAKAIEIAKHNFSKRGLGGARKEDEYVPPLYDDEMMHTYNDEFDRLRAEAMKKLNPNQE